MPLTPVEENDLQTKIAEVLNSADRLSQAVQALRMAVNALGGQPPIIPPPIVFPPPTTLPSGLSP